jgi:hypothetical protein
VSSFAEVAYYVLSFPPVKGAVFAGLLIGFLLPAVLELFIWRRG